MLGYIHSTGRWGSARLERYSVLGMGLLGCGIPGGPEHPFYRRHLKKGLRLLRRAGCHMLLMPCSGSSPLPLIPTRSLWQTMAARLALTVLKDRGLDPGASVVRLECDRLSTLLLRCCRELAPHVRGLALPAELDDRLIWQLQRRLGIAVICSDGDLTLSFLPEDNREKGLSLGMERPEISGYSLHLPGLELPSDCPELPLLAGLHQEGRLPVCRVAVVTTFP